LLIEKNFTFSIGGDGVLADQYKIMAHDLGISERCKFHGNIQRDGIAVFYSDIDIFVLPSRYETFGVVLIEAMACGIPVVATRCGGPEDIITAATGILIEKDNPEALAGAIIKISESPNSFNNIVIRKYVADNFSEGIFVEKVTNLYKELISLKTNE
jgi:L-malate glycosyltransferase